MMMDQIISHTPAAAQLLHHCMRNEVSDLHLKQMCCWWLRSPFLACNESDVVFRDAAHVWALTLEETSEYKVLRKGCQQHFKEYDRRKMTAFGPGIWVTCDVCTCIRRVILTRKRLPSTRLDSAAKERVGTSKGTIWSVPANTKPCTHKHTQNHNQLGFLTGTYKVIWACGWQLGWLLLDRKTWGISTPILAVKARTQLSALRCTFRVRRSQLYKSLHFRLYLSCKRCRDEIDFISPAINLNHNSQKCHFLKKKKIYIPKLQLYVCK